MKLAFAIVVAAAGASATALMIKPTPAVAGTSWSAAVTRICAHALLFEKRHEMGTRAGALAVARDIRTSTARRLARIAALPMAPPQPRATAHWVSIERHLAAVYARSYVQIFDVINEANTAAERAHEPALLRRLVHAPDRLQRLAARSELRLRVPDCTGGTVGSEADATPNVTVWAPG